MSKRWLGRATCAYSAGVREVLNSLSALKTEGNVVLTSHFLGEFPPVGQLTQLRIEQDGYK